MHLNSHNVLICPNKNELQIMDLLAEQKPNFWKILKRSYWIKEIRRDTKHQQNIWIKRKVTNFQNTKNLEVWIEMNQAKRKDIKHQQNNSKKFTNQQSAKNVKEWIERKHARRKRGQRWRGKRTKADGKLYISVYNSLIDLKKFCFYLAIPFCFTKQHKI